MRSWPGLAVAIIAAGCGHQGRELAPIRLVSLTTFGSDSGDGAIATTPVVSALHPGGYRVVIAQSGAIATRPMVFDGSGGFLGLLGGDSGRTVTSGRPMFTVIGPGDSLWVFDSARRALVYGPSRRYARAITLATSSPDPSLSLADAVVLPDGRIVATSAAAGAEMFDAAGAFEHDLGPRDSAESQARDPQRITLAPDGTLWTTTRHWPWRLQQWDTAGRLLHAIEPAAPWLVDSIAGHRTGYPNPDQPPPPTVRAIWLDVAGRLWVLGEVADRRWEEGFIRGASTGADRTDHIDPDKYLDTILEVRDPKNGALIAAARFDIACGSIAEPGVLVHETETRAGWRRAELLRVVFDETVLHQSQ